MLKKYASVFLCFSILCLLSPIVLAVDAETAAQKAAQKWLGLVDSGQYDLSWDTAAALLKNAITKAQWHQTISGVRPPMGRLISRNLISATYTTALPGAPDGEYVVIQFRSSFSNKKSAIETVTPMKNPDGIWQVSGYYIK